MFPSFGGTRGMKDIDDLRPYLCRVAINSMPRWLQRRVSPEDVVQETYLEAVKAKKAVGPGWMLTVLRHQIVQEMRKINRCGRERRGREEHGKPLDSHYGTGGEAYSEVELNAILNEEVAARGGRFEEETRKPSQYKRRLAKLSRKSF